MKMECPICQEGLDDSHDLECGHTFHTNCIVAWFRSGKASCPVCRDEQNSQKCNFHYVQRLCKMNSCPKFLKDAMRDYYKLKRSIDKIKSDLEFEIDKSVAKRKKKTLRSKQNLIKKAKNYIVNSNVFIVPIKKKIFID